tara:strand:- start:4292 stop:4621 length:330 start_codon:yes stop_codon:yes gene_type:complete
MPNDKLDKKKVEQIANFIVNNITFAEVSVMIVERATETAEFIVKNDLEPSNFNSPVSRKKLKEKIKIHKNKIEEKEEEGWLNNIINLFGPKKKKKEPEHRGFTTDKMKK